MILKLFILNRCETHNPKSHIVRENEQILYSLCFFEIGINGDTLSQY